jgi:hypothetical protein
MRSPYGIAKKVFYCKPARNILLTLVEPLLQTARKGSFAKE